MSKVQSVLERLEIEDDQQRENNLPKEQRNRSIPRDTGEFLSVFTRALGARTIVEIGTSVGYSTIWLGMTAKSTGGKVYSYEIDKERITKAQQNLEEAGLSNVVEVIHGGPDDVTFPKNIDVVFFDQEKEDYLRHFDKIFPNVRDGGVIIADNIISHFEELRLYIDHVRDHPECNSVLVPVGKGLEITYKFVDHEFTPFKTEVLIR